MPRDFFKRSDPGFTSVSGTVISDIQKTLNAMNGATIDVDGIYGRQTTTALTTFQSEHQLPTTGSVSDVTWRALMNSPEPPMFERCLGVVASFEGTGFTHVVGNFDGAGITWGIIGFTLKGGELGRILSKINALHPDLMGRAFGEDAAAILHITGSDTSDDEKIEWADSISRGSHKYNVANPWKTYFDNLGSFPEAQRIQIERAREVYWKIATRDCSDLGMGEELDYLLFYDIAVQNGGMRSKKRLQKAREAFQQQNPATAAAKRAIVAEIVTASITSKYKEDVRLRKTTIARGTGTVHGGKYDLSAWGFLNDETPASV
jgi:lysozyme family protein